MATQSAEHSLPTCCLKALKPDDLTAFLQDLGFSRGISRTVKAITDLLRAIDLQAGRIIGTQTEEIADTIAAQLQIIAEALQLPVDPPRCDSSQYAPD